MSPVLFCWLGAAALSPFVTILSAWTLVVLNAYRKAWRLVDIFLFTVTVYEMVLSLFGFGFSVLSIIRPALTEPCDFIVWGLTAGRTFHLSAVTSMLFERVLSSRRPRSFGFSMRRSQVRYHTVVLAIVAVFVGITAVFARSNSIAVCSIHPLSWDFKFSTFLASIYAMLLLTGVLCSLIGMFRPSPKYSRNCAPPASWKSGLSSSSGSSSSSEFLKPETASETHQEGWRTISAVCWISYLLNHGPFVVMTFMGILEPEFWSPWIDNATVWMGHAQGVLTPLTLLVVDSPYRRMVKAMLRKPGKLYRNFSDHVGLGTRLRNAKPRIPPSSAFPSHRLMPFYGSFHLPHRLRWAPTSLPSLQSLGQSPIVHSASGSQVTKDSSRCITPSAVFSQDTYSTLGSSCYTLLSYKSRSLDLIFDREESDVQSTDGASITTNALDDFEFLGGKVSENAPARVRAAFGARDGKPGPASRHVRPRKQRKSAKQSCGNRPKPRGESGPKAEEPKRQTAPEVDHSGRKDGSTNPGPVQLPTRIHSISCQIATSSGMNRYSDEVRNANSPAGKDGVSRTPSKDSDQAAKFAKTYLHSRSIDFTGHPVLSAVNLKKDIIYSEYL